jgi:hypothetical protein
VNGMKKKLEKDFHHNQPSPTRNLTSSSKRSIFSPETASLSTNNTAIDVKTVEEKAEIKLMECIDQNFNFI